MKSNTMSASEINNLIEKAQAIAGFGVEEYQIMAEVYVSSMCLMS